MTKMATGHCKEINGLWGVRPNGYIYIKIPVPMDKTTSIGLREIVGARISGSLLLNNLS